MVRSLLGQLLEKAPRLISQGVMIGGPPKVKSLTSLCGLLEDVILGLPRDTIVFCAIDSINIHEENSTGYDEFEELMESLVQIRMRTATVGCVFKLMIAYAWNSHRFYKLLPDQKRQVIWLPVKVPPQGGLTKAKWKAIMEKNILLLV
jgi:hypothetical protein